MNRTIKNNNPVKPENTYTFSYIHNAGFGSPLNIDFSAEQVGEALCFLPSYDVCCEHHLKVMLKEIIEIWGRTLKGKPLSETHHVKKIAFVNCALQGCEVCLRQLKLDMAVYLALHLDEIAENESQYGTADNKSVFFFFDIDESEVSDVLTTNLTIASTKPSTQVLPL